MGTLDTGIDVDLVQAMIDAAARVGGDGRGAGGFTGWLRTVAARYPKQFAKLASQARVTSDDPDGA